MRSEKGRSAEGKGAVSAGNEGAVPKSMAGAVEVLRRSVVESWAVIELAV